MVPGLLWFLEYVGYSDLRLPDSANKNTGHPVKFEFQITTDNILLQVCSMSLFVVYLKLKFGGLYFIFHP